jgi:hypothetical protein
MSKGDHCSGGFIISPFVFFILIQRESWRIFSPHVKQGDVWFSLRFPYVDAPLDDSKVIFSFV